MTRPDTDKTSLFTFARRWNAVSAAAAALAILSLLTLGCSLLGDKTSNENAANVGAPEASPEASVKEETASGPCANEYYPIDPGVKKVYKSTSSIAGTNTEITLSQSAPEGDTFTEMRTLTSGTTVKTPWKCTPEGLRIAEYQNVIDASKARFKMETVESSGTTVPSTWNVGEEWGSDYKVNVKLNAGPVNTNATGTVKIKEKLVSKNDKVTVPGGTYDAAKVESMISITITYGGRKIPSPDVKLIRWYAPGVGLVKQQVTNDVYGNETIEYAGPAGS